MRLTLFCISIVAVFVSCKKDDIDVNSFWECSQAQHRDTTIISTTLVGSWKWIKQSCFWEGKTKSADRDIKMTFNNNHTFSVNENTTILTQGTWKLVPVDGTSFTLDLSSQSEYLYGRILLCDSQLLLNDSYRDGCDNMFQKDN